LENSRGFGKATFKERGRNMLRIGATSYRERFVSRSNSLERGSFRKRTSEGTSKYKPTTNKARQPTSSHPMGLGSHRQTQQWSGNPKNCWETRKKV
jgi:hypothetical protein